MEWLEPQPRDEALSEIYQSDYYDAWGLREDAEATQALKRATFRRWLRPVAGEFAAGGRLLDCGAAFGYLMEEAAAAGLEPYGVELLELGARRISERFGAERVFQGRFEEAEFTGAGSAFFDVITMTDFLEHVRDAPAVLSKAFRLLRPGGRLVIVTPDAGSVSCKLMGQRWLHYKVEHLAYFTRASLRHLLTGAGFVDMHVTRATKAMSLHYVRHQLNTYWHPLLTPATNLVYRLSNRSVRNAMFPISFGEQLCWASKPSGG